MSAPGARTRPKNDDNAAAENQNDAADAAMPPRPARLSPAALALERAALERILRAFRGYRAALEAEVRRWERNVLALRDPRHRALLLPPTEAKCAAARLAGDANQAFLDAMLEAFEEQGGVDGVLGAVASGGGGGEEEEGGCCGGHGHRHGHDHGGGPTSADDAATTTPTAEDVDKVRYVLKNVARDWSEEGAAEREASYGRIVAELRRLLMPGGGAEGEGGGGDGPAAPNRRRRQRRPAVLVPGAGLARLCVDICAAGMRAQGNEFSYYMLVASAFLLNGSPAPLCRAVHPWAHATLNQLTAAGQVRGVLAPDALPQELLARGGWDGGEGGEGEGEEEDGWSTEVEEEEDEGVGAGAGAAATAASGATAAAGAPPLPSSQPPQPSIPRPPRHRPALPPLSMCAGDFEEVYGAPGMRARFDAVATCFFLDTARNVVRYLEVIWHALRPGGYWVHLGPLLWHWGGGGPEEEEGEAGCGGDDRGGKGEDGDVSIELSLDEVARVAQALGFREVRSELVRAPYMGEFLVFGSEGGRWWGSDGARALALSVASSCGARTRSHALDLSFLLPAPPPKHQQQTRSRCSRPSTPWRFGPCRSRRVERMDGWMDGWG